MSTVYLLRHGITEGNIKRLYYGITDLPLAKEGIDAVSERKNAGIYPDKNGFKLITSGLLRTKQTLFEIYGNDVDFISDPRLNEIDFGDFEMKSYDELKDREDYKEWISGDNWRKVCPNGESGEIMCERAFSALDEYVKEDCIIVCHGGIITSYIQKLFPNDSEHNNYYEWQPKPCEGYKIVFDDTGKAESYKKISKN